MKKKNEERSQQIIDYLEQHYTEAISLEDLAQELGLSAGYLSRHFQELQGITFSQALRQIRLSNAAEDLTYTDDPITQIAYRNGFSGAAFFNRVFREAYHVTPSEFRKANKAAAESGRQKLSHLEDPALNQAGTYTAGSFPASAKRSRNHMEETFSLTDDEELEPCWNKVINIGPARSLMDAAVQEHILMLQENQGFHMVRFWNIFSPEMVINPIHEGFQPNFSRLDQILDFLVDHKLRPFLDLEEKPESIRRSKNQLLYQKSAEKTIDISLSQWEHLLNSFMAHAVRRYGENEVSGWIAELSFYSFRLHGRDQLDSFFGLFRSTYTIIKKYAPGMMVGGCNHFPESILPLRQRSYNFWEKWILKAPQMDFVSMMSFAYEPDSSRDRYGDRSSDPQYLSTGIDRLRNELASAGIINKPIFVTEWNQTVSDRNYMNDTCHHGAYIIKNAIDTMNKAAVIAYYSGTDTVTDYYDSGKILFGGQGLLTRSGIPKPAAYAFSFLNHLYPHVFGKSSNTMLTGDLRGNYAIVCHNMKTLNNAYYRTSEDEIDFRNINSCFEDTRSLQMKLQQEDIENGTYIVKYYRVNDDFGSILSLWKELMYYSDLPREDIQYLRRACDVNQSWQEVHVGSHTLALAFEMKPNEILMIRLQKDL